MTREILLRRLADIIISLNSAHPLRIAIDGIDAAGKTMLADELATLIEAQGRPVIRASVDDFHRPRHERYQRGPDSPEGYYQDSFDYEALRDQLLSPLGTNGNGMYRRAVFDFRIEAAVRSPEEKAPAHAVLLFDGIFLLRPELVEQWDYRIFVHVKAERALQRAMQRDLPLFGSAEAVQARYLQRYIPGQRLYFQLAHPLERADVIVDNDDPQHPQLIFSSQSASLRSFKL